MRYRVQTLSGAQYVIDTDLMTWQRTRPKSGQGIIGTDRDDGQITLPVPEAIIGERMTIYVNIAGENTYISTTQVQRIELL